MGLRQDVLQDPVSELGLREALALPVSATVSEAVDLMKTKGLGCICVVNESGVCQGTFTERGMTHLLLSQGDSGMGQAIGEHLSGAWASVRATDPIATVIDAMESHKLRFVVVVDEAGKPVSLTGQKGVMEYLVDHFPRQVKVQAMDSKLYMDQREGG